VLAVFMVVGFGGHVVSDNALVVVPVMGIVQVPVIGVVDVAGVFHRAMPAVRPMDVKIAIRGSSAWFPSSFLILAWHPGVGADHPATHQRVIRISDVPTTVAPARAVAARSRYGLIQVWVPASTRATKYEIVDRS